MMRTKFEFQDIRFSLEPQIPPLIQEDIDWVTIQIVHKNVLNFYN